MTWRDKVTQYEKDNNCRIYADVVEDDEAAWKAVYESITGETTPWVEPEYDDIVLRSKDHPALKALQDELAELFANEESIAAYLGDEDGVVQ